MAGEDNKFQVPSGGTEHKFLTMTVPPRRKDQLIIESRVGVPDYAVWIDAARGEPGVVQAAADTDDFERDARIYNSMIGFVYEITYHGDLLPDRYMVQHVESRIGPLLWGPQVIAPNPPVAMIYTSWTVFAMEQNP